MEMTDRQFQGLIRLSLDKIMDAQRESPDNKEIQELLDIFQLMLEDGN